MNRRAALLGYEHIVVVSPHLDDAALSLGATIARLTRRGRRVTVATVFAGDPEIETDASEWDLRCGFSSSAEATRARREEDAAACALLGAEPHWLPFGDEEHPRGGDADRVWGALEPVLAPADVVLVPGHPLVNEDHAWLSRLVLERLETPPIGLYIEQPYAANLTVGRGTSLRPLLRAARLAATTGIGHAFAPTLPAQLSSVLTQPTRWHGLRPTRAERRSKDAAVRAYASQVGIETLGRRLLLRIRLYETATGGEHVALLTSPA